MKRACIVLGTAILALCDVRAQNPPPTCQAPPRVQVIASLAALPVPIRDAVLQKSHDMVEPDQHFDATDSVMYGAHFNRFAFAWKAGSRYVVATERGGIAYSNPLYIFAWPDGSAPPKLLAERAPRRTDICSQAIEALSTPTH